MVSAAGSLHVCWLDLAFDKCAAATKADLTAQASRPTSASDGRLCQQSATAWARAKASLTAREGQQLKCRLFLSFAWSIVCCTMLTWLTGLHGLTCFRIICRVIITDHGAFVLINVYVPNAGGSKGSDERPRAAFKLQFMRALRDKVDVLHATGKQVCTSISGHC